MFEAVVELHSVSGDDPNGPWLFAKTGVNYQQQCRGDVGGSDVHVGLEDMNVRHVACHWECRCVMAAVVREAEEQVFCTSAPASPGRKRANPRDASLEAHLQQRGNWQLLH